MPVAAWQPLTTRGLELTPAASAPLWSPQPHPCALRPHRLAPAPAHPPPPSPPRPARWPLGFVVLPAIFGAAVASRLNYKSHNAPRAGQEAGAVVGFCQELGGLFVLAWGTGGGGGGGGGRTGVVVCSTSENSEPIYSFALEACPAPAANIYKDTSCGMVQSSLRVSSSRAPRCSPALTGGW